MQMKCLLCDRRLPDGLLLCDDCALSSTGEWHTDRQIDGLLRLLETDTVFAFLDGRGIAPELEPLPLGERVELFQNNASGYREACSLFNSLMESMGQKLDGNDDFIPPLYSQVSPLIKRLEQFELSLPGKGERETYERLHHLYISAAKHTHLPLASREFNQDVKERLLTKSEFWLQRVQQGTEAQQHPSNSTVSRTLTEPPAAFHEAQRTATGEEPVFISLLRKRGRVSFYCGEYGTALSTLLELRGAGYAKPDDLNMLCISALAMSRNDIIQDVGFEVADGFSPRVFIAATLWRKEMWGKAIQLLDSEIVERSSPAALVFRNMLSRQYGLKDRYSRLQEQSSATVAEGVNIVASIYTALGMWGAVLQCIRGIEERHRNSETWTLYGGAMQLGGNLSAASDAFSRALSLSPVSEHAYVGRALLSCALGRHDEAVKYLEMADTLKPAVRRIIAKELDELGDSRAALHEITELLSDDPDNAEAASLGVTIAGKAGAEAMEKSFRAYMRRSVHHAL